MGARIFLMRPKSRHRYRFPDAPARTSTARSPLLAADPARERRHPLFRPLPSHPGRNNLSNEQYLSFRDIKVSELKTSKAWFIKESFRFFWEQPGHRDEAKEYFKEWYRHAICSKLSPMKKVARLLKSHLDSLLTWWEHRITNALSEVGRRRLPQL